MRKPNALIHMALWGTTGGIGTASLYLIVLIVAFGASFDLWHLFVLAALYGGVPGAVLGVMDGLIVQAVLNDESISELDDKRKVAQTRVATLTFFGMLLFLGLAISPMLFIYIYASLVPPIIAMSAAVYATKRYFLRVAELNGLKAKHRQDEEKARLERLAVRTTQEQQSLSTHFAKVQKKHHHRS